MEMRPLAIILASKNVPQNMQLPIHISSATIC